jgi:hypothetical protein
LREDDDDDDEACVRMKVMIECRFGMLLMLDDEGCWRLWWLKVGEVAASGCCCGGLRWLKGRRSLLGWLVMVGKKGC